MTLVQPGDLIFAGIDNALRAFAEVSRPAYDATRPDPRDDQFWYGEGWRLDVQYTDLPKPMYYSDWVLDVADELPPIHSPFRDGARPNQGYLYSLPNSVGEYLVDRAAIDGVDVVSTAEAAVETLAGGETERAALRSARLGQGKFRKALIKRWNGKCPLSTVAHPKLLRASHIKPWSSSNNFERLDPANGLLLSAAYDAAFDALLVSFSDEGTILLAQDFSDEAARAAGIDSEARVHPLDSAARPYLAEHRALMAARVAREAQVKATVPNDVNV